MSKTLFKNLTIINPIGESKLNLNTSIVSEDGIITEIGSQHSDLSNYQSVFDMGGKYVLPGMINAHNHLYSSLALGMPAPRIKPVNFVEKLQQVWWKLDLALDDASTHASFQVGLMSALESGVTTIMDHHSSQNYIDGSIDHLVKVADKFGIRIGTAIETSDRNGKKIFESALQENINSIEKYRSNPFVHPMMGLHASFTLSDNSLSTICNHLNEIDNPGIHIHVAEDRADHKDAVKRGYRSVIDRLNSAGIINKDSLLIHGIHLEPEDIEIIKSKGAFLVHCPTSNAGNRVGKLSAKTLGILPVALGTDGKQANMLNEVNQAEIIRSSHLKGPDKNIDYPNLLFNNNSEMVSRLFNQKIGRIEIGYQADLVMYEYNPNTELNESNIMSHVFGGFASPSDVITRGKFRIRDFEFVDINKEDVLANACQESVKLWKKIEKIG
ncbi:MAG: amidohydrolase family protein [Candidatus Marinimicrobia bacterium]|jgi:putative selenium metabolism protein SsnA|nr:amidohydrolase family protein [Candidatus Neomarinimicrobiota bacterium]MBT3633752.1 amidohydrolase family protein [Candidatus Neomarinimicrobiota bacterium]MBT3682544.1 amidohydrolase family protein [Candidatus Neomarinimicrobiota bacterium]MBT3759308.1 amidohydrolase family protein [Candidatus Neomarinimicrobiota bacterium]MBT3894684.1 amidohydrolase family protein [Candidatus Neomarinimicrobiota bacterium]